MKKTQVLAFGSHQDDVELGAGGTLLKLKKIGMTTGVVSLSRSEMNSRTTPEQISREAGEAAKVLKLDVRETLDLGDCKIEDSYRNRVIIAEVIRKFQPDIILAPFFQDRHTDHENTGKLIRSSLVLSRLKKLNNPDPPYGPKIVLYYLLQVPTAIAPSMVVDITDIIASKNEAVKCYRSQFEKTASEQGILPIGIGDYLFHIESRDRYYGSLINVKYGEAFVSEGPILLSNLSQLLTHE